MARIISVNKITPELLDRACTEVEATKEVIYLWSLELTYKVEPSLKSWAYRCIPELQMKEETNFSQSNIQIENW